jgi:ferritin-like metal-binding protein YciE
LDKVVEVCKIKLKREKCDAREGLIEEGSRIIKEVNASPVELRCLSPLLSHKVEHYEISACGFLIALTKTPGYLETPICSEIFLDQEKATDEKLHGLAKTA